MKITSDVNLLISGSRNLQQGAPVLKRVVNPPQKQPTVSQMSSQALSRLQMEKTLGEALSIAQMSQSILQKAMNVSSRLSSIASQAMRSGRVDTIGLNQVINQIDTVISDYGEKIIVPVHSGKTESMKNYNAAVNQFKELKGVSSDIKGNRPVDTGRIDKMSERISLLQSSVTQTRNNLKSRMNSLIKEYSSVSESKADELAGNTRELIMKSPESAKRSHAEINTDKTGINFYR